MSDADAPLRACFRCSDAAGVTHDPTKHVTHPLGAPCPLADSPRFPVPPLTKYHAMVYGEDAQPPRVGWMEVYLASEVEAAFRAITCERDEAKQRAKDFQRETEAMQSLLDSTVRKSEELRAALTEVRTAITALAQELVEITRNVDSYEGALERVENVAERLTAAAERQD